MNRCLVCNAESFLHSFCSQKCEDSYSDLMEEIWDSKELTEEQECELLSDYTISEGED